MPVKKEFKQIELWPGHMVDVTREDLLHDLDYLKDLQRQLKDNDLSLVDTLFALIGGEETLSEFREHVIEEKGVFDVEEVGAVAKKLLELLPKAPSSSSKRW